MRLAQEHLSPAQLKDAVLLQSYKLTTTGQVRFDFHPEAVAKHQKKG